VEPVAAVLQLLLSQQISGVKHQSAALAPERAQLFLAGQPGPVAR
jgi:hypothetical protein